MSTFDADFDGLGEMLNADWMQAAMRERAQAGMDFARTISPVGPGKDGSHYVEKFEVSSGTHGGYEHDRAYGRLENTDDAALWVEIGSKNNDAHHVLGKSLDVMGG